MKATEVLNHYAQGERDFRGVNLRGQNFKKQNLSGADFSGADIRGANFTNATLRQVNFTEARGGLQEEIRILRLSCSLFLLLIIGFCFGETALNDFSSIAKNLLNSNITLVLAAIIRIITIIVLLVIFIRRGLSFIFGVIVVLTTVQIASLVTRAAIDLSRNSSSSMLSILDILDELIPNVWIPSLAISASIVSATVISISGSLDRKRVLLWIVIGTVGRLPLFTFANSDNGIIDFKTFWILALSSLFAVSWAILSALVGWYAISGDEKQNLIRKITNSFITTGGTSFRNADLTNAIFSKGVLKSSDFREATLVQTCWAGAQCLGFARIGNSILKNPVVLKLLTSRDGSYKSYIDINLRAADLDGVNLEGSNLNGADLTYATLRHANLKDANLAETQVLQADFTGATMTGACLEAWNIDSSTVLDQVDCQYVYLLRDKQERRPSSGNFAPGEFTKLFQEVLSTVDLIFRNGVDWKAFVAAFKQVQVQNEDTSLEVQSIENKGEGVIVVRVSVPQATDKAKIHSEFNQQYEFALKALEARYQAELQVKDGQIAIYREQSANMMEITKLLASRPINVEANAVSNSQSSGDTYNGPIKATNFAPHGTAIGGTFNDYSQTITNNLDEIQQLITTLRSQAAQFPPDARNEVLEHLNDLQDDLKHPDKVKPSRLKATFAALLAISIGLGGAVAAATDFANNVLELGNKFGVELVHPQGTQSAQSPHSQSIQTMDVKRLEGESR